MDEVRDTLSVIRTSGRMLIVMSWVMPANSLVFLSLSFEHEATIQPNLPGEWWIPCEVSEQQFKRHG